MKERAPKGRTQQELPFDSASRTAMSGRRRLPPEEAAWWFARMREAVAATATACSGTTFSMDMGGRTQGGQTV